MCLHKMWILWDTTSEVASRKRAVSQYQISCTHIVSDDLLLQKVYVWAKDFLSNMVRFLTSFRNRTSLYMYTGSKTFLQTKRGTIILPDSLDPWPDKLPKVSVFLEKRHFNKRNGLLDNHCTAWRHKNNFSPSPSLNSYIPDRSEDI